MKKKSNHVGIAEKYNAIKKKEKLNSLSDTPTHRETQNVNKDSSTSLNSEYTYTHTAFLSQSDV